jgi:hypothetical protein
MKSNLDKWFQAAQDAEPVMSVKEVEAMIRTGVSPYTKKAGTGSALKTFIIMGTTLLGLAGLIGLLTFRQPASTPQQDTKNGINRHQLTAIGEITPSRIVVTEKKTDTAPAGITTNTTVVAGQHETPFVQEESAPHLLTPVTDVTDYIEEPVAPENTDIITLRNIELAKFGIRTDGASLKFISLMGEKNDTSVFKLEISRSGYWNSVAGINYTELKVKKPGNIVPVAIERVNLESGNSSYPMLSENIPFAMYNQFMQEARAMLVGIRVTPKGLHKNNGELVFWYKPTAAFMELLPEDVRPYATLQYRKFAGETYSSLVSKYLEAEKQHLAEKSQLVSPGKVTLVQPRTIELAKDDLRKLHIDYNGTSFEYKSKFIYNGKPAKLTITFKNDHHSYAIDYDNKVLIGAAASGKAIYPVAFSDSTMQDISFIEIESKATGGLTAAEREKKRLADFMAATDTLVGIKIPVYHNGVRTPVIMWFEPTVALKEALPSLDVSRGEQVTDRKIDLTGIKLLELDNNSLMWLGVTINNDKGISVPMLMDGYKALFTTYSKYGTSFTTSEFKQSSGKTEKQITITINDGKGTQYQVAPETVGKQYPAPVLVTDDLGKYWRSYRMEDESDRNNTENELMERISTLIPILVRSGDAYTAQDKQKKRWRPDVILWYEPTPQFLEWLPELLGKEIGTEYEAITRNQPASTCKYFDACLNVKGRVKSYKVYPNPVVSDLKVVLDLEEAREVSISITDITGRVVKTLMSNITQQAGPREYALDVSGMPEGIYLLLIETNQDERIIQRLIVK